MQIELDKHERLIMTASPDERRYLLNVKERFQNDEENFDCDELLNELFSNFVMDPEKGELAAGQEDGEYPVFEWAHAHEFGDLTDAPIICYRAYSALVSNTNAGEGTPLGRWAFMDYQVVSVQELLLSHGKAIWLGGWMKGILARSIDSDKIPLQFSRSDRRK